MKPSFLATWIAVAPYKGAWIEMAYLYTNNARTQVAPYKGAWIEIGSASWAVIAYPRRSLQGSVD